MISVCEDKADPFDDFFFVLGLEDLDATTKDLDAIVDDLENHWRIKYERNFPKKKIAKEKSEND